MRRPKPEEILEWSAKTGEPAKFTGSKVFGVLWEKGTILPHHTVVRIIRAGVEVEGYGINRMGFLFEIQDKEEKPIRSEDVLSKVKSPEGWRIYKFLRIRKGVT